jgi:hypothetical protein
MIPDPASTAPPETGRAENPPDSCKSPEEVFASLRGRVDEFVDYAVYYLISRIDALKFAIKRRILMASLICVAVLAAAGAIITAVVLVAEGLCDGLTDLLGHRWAGEFATGALLLGIVAIGGIFAMTRFMSGPHLRTVRQYEALRQRQCDKRGCDVTNRPGDGENHGQSSIPK